MGLFDRKPSLCSVCKKKLKHKHKPKREWNIKGLLCGECYMDKMKEFYEAKIRQPCVSCGVTQKVSDLWEPRWQWEMEGLLCKQCFDKKEEEYQQKQNFCSICGTKLGFIRYNPKGKWKIDGQLCRKCWDEQKAKYG